jgi:cytochrome P450
MAVLDRQLQPDGWTQFVDLQPLFFRLTLDSATEFLFGESVGSQLIDGPDKPEADEEFSFAYAFDRSQYVLSIAARLGSNYWVAHTPQFHRMVKRVHSFVDYFVQLALSQDAEKGNSADKGKYVFLHALAQETRDPNELRSQLLNILLAGRDTTASTLGWFFFTMADPQYQSVFTKLRGIVLDEFGSYKDPKDVTFEKMKSCQYLQWSINECLRLYPVVSTQRENCNG